ncbi:hypothetical protein [Capnocytophaga sputigena]|jgi:hypothetical protein|uniref:hypothetical protein n=1 Tax=Capnocytophaga sputigena TaxID=1019 RepID=UPI0028EA1FF8|nr:hypothetical protein [Capnocytophaga sputigena]
MVFIENFPIKANNNTKNWTSDNPETLKQRVSTRLYEGNLNRFFLMRDRNRRETFSFDSPVIYKKTDEKGNVVQIKRPNCLETFCYDEEGYVTQYEYYREKTLCRKETTSYLYNSDSVRIAEVTNIFYEDIIGEDFSEIRFTQSQVYKVIRDVYEYLENGKVLKSQRFFTNIPFDEGLMDNEEYEKYTCEEYLAYEQFYDGKWDILKKRLAYNQEGKVVEVALYTQSSNDNYEGVEDLLIEEYNEEYEKARYSIFYSPQKLDIDYRTLSTFEMFGFVNYWGDIRLGSVTFNEQGNIDNGYILSYEGSNQDDSGDWLTFESGRENAEGEIVWGCEYEWRGYTWELSLYENGEFRERITSEVYLSANETISVFMPLKTYRKD